MNTYLNNPTKICDKKNVVENIAQVFSGIEK